MHHVRQENLPFIGNSHQFVGAEQGDTSISVYLFHGKAGSGPGPHRHPYDEIQFIREGRGVWTVNGETFEGAAGDIFVIKAGEIHSFKAVGDAPLIQLDVHVSPRFIQENLYSLDHSGSHDSRDRSRYQSLPVVLSAATC
jgi:quercetin dioxygenase-like cupin family protein